MRFSAYKRIDIIIIFTDSNFLNAFYDITEEFFNHFNNMYMYHLNYTFSPQIDTHEMQFRVLLIRIILAHPYNKKKYNPHMNAFSN